MSSAERLGGSGYPLGDSSKNLSLAMVQYGFDGLYLRKPERGDIMQRLPKPCIWAGMTFMLVIGAVHLLAVPQAFDDAAYKGVLFLISVVCAFFAAMGIQEGALVRGWWLGSLVAGATLASFVASGTVGLPGLSADPQTWQEPKGVLAVAAEVLMLSAALWAVLAARRARHSFAA